MGPVGLVGLIRLVGTLGLVGLEGLVGFGGSSASCGSCGSCGPDESAWLGGSGVFTLAILSDPKVFLNNSMVFDNPK